MFVQIRFWKSKPSKGLENGKEEEQRREAVTASTFVGL
jgi:hypothetical protein